MPTKETLIHRLVWQVWMITCNNELEELIAAFSLKEEAERYREMFAQSEHLKIEIREEI